MDYDALLSQVIALLQRQGRVSYWALKRRFDLSDNDIEGLQDELIYAQQVARDEDNRILVWSGETEEASGSTSQPEQTKQPDTQESQPISVEPLPTEPRPREAERRQLTVMFCDLVDSTKLSSQLDPEDYREVVREYQQVCSEVISRYDGYIAQYLGDGLLVYFGYPVAHEEDAHRAVYAGLGILNAMKSLNTSLKPKDVQLAIRLGIHTGLVVVGEMGGAGRQEQLALGEVPNVASRIQGIAEADTLVISSSTYRLVQGYFEFQELGEYAFRGVSDPVVVYRVHRESGAQSRLDVASIRGLTPLVGRESEVTLLLERWAQVRDAQGQIVLLSGEGGIGKSRLVQVLKDHVAEEAHTRWECRSSPYYQNTALYPLIDLLQRALQWHQDDLPEQRLEKLEHLLSQYRLPLEETVVLFAPLLSLSVPEDRYPPLNLSPQRQRQKTLESIVAILLELAEPQPVLFILEDLHWTDPTTLEFLSLLAEQVPTAAIYTLLTCRPYFQPSWYHRSYLTEVTVNRLFWEQIEQVAQHVAGGKNLPGAVLQQLVERTDGVPLFVEEMTKTVLESGVLKEANGQYELSGSLSTLSIPATLQDSLMARLDRLVTAKGIAQIGATIGRQFSHELLQAHHSMWMALYHHGDLTAVRSHCQQGTQLYDPDQHHAQTYVDGNHDPGVCAQGFGCRTLWLLGCPDQARQMCGDMLTLARQLKHPLSLIQAHAWSMWVHAFFGEYQLALEQAETTATLAAEQGIPYWVSHGMMMRGWLHVETGEVKAGLTQFYQGLEVIQSLRARSLLPWYLLLLAEAHGKQGQIDLSLRAIASGLDAVNQHEIFVCESELYRLKGELLLKQLCPDVSEAESCFHHAISIAQNQSAKSWELRAATSLARLWRSQGKRQEAYDLLAPVYGWFTEGFDTADLKDAKTLLGELEGGQS